MGPPSRIETDAEDVVPISLVAHHVFCPRRAWLEARGERTDTEQVASGHADHETVDDVTTSRATRVHAVDVRSSRFGLSGRCDTVEMDGSGGIRIVEHKAAPIRRTPDVTDAQRVQLALQALCLKEMGYRVTGAAVWFTTLRRRVAVELTEPLMELARMHLAETRRIIQAAIPPAALEDDPRCRFCSHVGVCLPDEHRGRRPARRIAVGDPIGRVLHLATPGSRASLSRGRVVVRQGDGTVVNVPLGQVSGIVVHGNADLSSALVREVLGRGLTIVWCSWAGRVVGWAAPVEGPNGAARRRQHRLNAKTRLVTGRLIVAAKVRNQAVVLRRHGLPERVDLRRLARDAESAGSVTALLGIEGRAAATYFRALNGALVPSWARIERRTAHPARDYVNAALNVAYSLLLADVLRALVACGLDAHGGVLHSPVRNKPALALDLMEELRAPIADAAVLWALNNGEVREEDFRRDLDGVWLRPRGRKALIAAYERRVNTEFRHPHFGYKVTWRRAMEIQARLFLALVENEVDVYRPIALR